MSKLFDEDASDRLLFQRLKKEWDEKLRASGFVDIENNHHKNPLLHKWHDSLFRIQYSSESFAAKQEYYRRATVFLHHFPFHTQKAITKKHDKSCSSKRGCVFWCPRWIEIYLDKKIWSLHADGLPLREIATVISDVEKIKRNKDQIQKVINRLQKAMKEWIFDDDD